MADYVLVESQGGWLGPGAERFLGDAVALAEGGHRVWLVLIENGVTGAIGDAHPALDRIARFGGQVWIDGFSLAERGLDAAGVCRAVSVVGMEEIAERLLAPNVKAVWH